MEPMHKLLKRQLKRQLGETDTLPGAWQAFLAAVNEVYVQADADRTMLERSLELSSLELLMANETLQHQALHDPLTDLPNRQLLLTRIEEAVLVAEQCGSGMVLLMLDLDRFKEVNDTFGHQLGDLLLQQVGRRLCQAVDAAATVARLGGDEFAVFLPTADEACAQEVALALGRALETSFLVRGVSPASRSQHRHRPAPDTRKRCSDPFPPRGCRDVRRQTEA